MPSSGKAKLLRLVTLVYLVLTTVCAMKGPWRCSGNTNKELVDNLWKSGIIKDAKVRQAMRDTDRGYYAPTHPYDDMPQPIGHAQTISAPHMHAAAAEILAPVLPPEGGKVLDIGVGSGYLAAVFARMVGKTGKVWGIDYLAPLVNLSEVNIRRDDGDLITSERIILETRNGWEGWPEVAPFDAIHVGAAAETIPPKLVHQLKLGGRMFIPVGPYGGPQELMQVDRTEKGYTTRHLMDVAYVPLVKKT
ncbi:protein-L-isoaspartate O-methyltransferase-like protein [Tribonema minus]|uniref:protein-L-isoaspartate(D-aspartate) O-methyltransferase n=1 Tax=Tribonema minus TaxID=303371 RepID=A0A836CP96_9STRA|nr:protein-L-isoaspartate O-methyltransferase-like protein [Tribonema minus]